MPAGQQYSDSHWASIWDAAEVIRKRIFDLLKAEGLPAPDVRIKETR
jgi:hypothetical protein